MLENKNILFDREGEKGEINFTWFFPVHFFSFLKNIQVENRVFFQPLKKHINQEVILTTRLSNQNNNT